MKMNLCTCAALAALMLLAPFAPAQPQDESVDGPSPREMVNAGADFLVSVEEGAGKKGPGGEWPYEGVYRVRGQIPIGYRVGGTGIACLAMAMSPEYVESKPQQEAVARGVAFIIESVKHPLMNPDYDGGYDVRGWGYTYGGLLLLQLESRGLLPEDQEKPAHDAAAFYVDAIEQTAIPKVGGWNYARARGKDAVSPPSPFMTSPTLQTLFLARSLGYEVDPAVVDKALNALEAARKPSGEFVYAGDASKRRPGGVPGAVGRMMASETTLFLAGRSTPAQVRGALDAFIVHWAWLEKRRQQTGTHIPPYNIAPYYFYYAHLAAAQAIECLPKNERAEYRKHLIELLRRTRDDDGTWNDRVFERSANYGTAMAILALRTPAIGLVPQWQPPAEPDAENQP